VADLQWQERGPVQAGDWPAARAAARLLSYLDDGAHADPKSEAADGPRRTTPAGSRTALAQGDIRVGATPTTTADDWLISGVAELTGPAGGPPAVSDGDPATVARGAALAFELITGVAVEVTALLGERAHLMGLRRNGQTAAGGATRLLPARDGWWALNLARDGDLVPALIGAVPVDHADPWPDVAAWGILQNRVDIVQRTTLLGLAAAALAETTIEGPPWRITQVRAHHPTVRSRPLVVNLGALWAGPLAAQLVARAGADVIDVESKHRPDPTPTTAPQFYARLHAGHTRRQIDFGSGSALADLIRTADIVIEASRPRALRGLGVDAESVLADGRSRTWLRITGHRDPNRIAFGDDAAVAGGLVAWDDQRRPVFVGDAIADPLTGLMGALAVVAHHQMGSVTSSRASSRIIDVAMADVAAYCAAPSSPLDWQAGRTGTLHR
jgi:hypothetical protein